MKKTSKITSEKNESSVGIKSLFLINDDFNTFDHVVDCLVAICDHDPIQAEQCAVLTHYKGSCEVLVGEASDLEYVKEDLAIYGLDVEIL